MRSGRSRTSGWKIAPRLSVLHLGKLLVSGSADRMTRAAVASDQRGYFGVALWHPKHSVNLGTLLRSAHIFGAAFVCTIGERYRNQASDTIKTPRHTPLFHFADEQDFWIHIPS